MKKAIFFFKSQEIIRCFRCSHKNYRSGIKIKLCNINCGRFNCNWICYDYKFNRTSDFVIIEAIYGKEEECKVCEQSYFPRATFAGIISINRFCYHCNEIKKYNFKLDKNIICHNCSTVLLEENHIINLCQECHYNNSNNISGIWKIEKYSSSEVNHVLINFELKKPIICLTCYKSKTKKLKKLKKIKNKN